MRGYALVLLLTFVLSGCVGMLSGTVSTATYLETPRQSSFTIVTPDSLSLTDRHISVLIEKKMLERGYVKTDSPKSANVAVLYKYSVGPGATEISSNPSGTQIATDTTFPRFFQIMIVDLQKSKIPEKIEVIWQGELRSRGGSENISKLAPYFIDVLFENYGGTVMNKRFFKTIEW